ncbi:hypothetical protein BQ8420_10700 [Nocardiopsis sp. JB363]|nr:hypothetical protein BQ8420_10700 [Nocardiopsis sp. JB363]
MRVPGHRVPPVELDVLPRAGPGPRQVTARLEKSREGARALPFKRSSGWVRQTRGPRLRNRCSIRKSTTGTNKPHTARLTLQPHVPHPWFRAVRRVDAICDSGQMTTEH